jgi:hypothetical protein
MIAACLWGAAHAQVQTSASRTIRLDVAIVRYHVTVDALGSVAEEAVYAALRGLPLDAAHLQSCEYHAGGVEDDTQDAVRYEFAFATPFAAFRETASRLDTVGQAPPAAILKLSYTVSAEAAPDAAEQAQTRLLPELLTEARDRAEELALASGRALGALRSMQPLVTSMGYVQLFALRSDRFTRTDGAALGEPRAALVTVSLAATFDFQ